jgi:hypothetical protein
MAWLLLAADRVARAARHGAQYQAMKMTGDTVFKRRNRLMRSLVCLLNASQWAASVGGRATEWGEGIDAPR